MALARGLVARIVVAAAAAALIAGCGEATPVEDAGASNSPAVAADGGAPATPPSARPEVDAEADGPVIADGDAAASTPRRQPPHTSTGSDDPPDGAVSGARADRSTRGAAGAVTVVGRASDRVVDAAVRDLRERPDVASGRVRVVLAERVIWPDATVGCPLRDGETLGGPVRGTRVHLRVRDLLFRYHSGGGRDPFLCDPAEVRIEEQRDRIEP